MADPAASNPELYTLHQQIISAVEKPPDAQRTVMLLVAVEGLSYREAATVFDVPIGTVMSRLARARLAIGEVARGYRPARGPTPHRIQNLAAKATKIYPTNMSRHRCCWRCGRVRKTY